MKKVEYQYRCKRCLEVYGQGNADEGIAKGELLKATLYLERRGEAPDVPLLLRHDCTLSSLGVGIAELIGYRVAA